MSDGSMLTFDWSMVDLTPGVCARRGGLHLDKWFGDWALRVDLSIMDVASIEYCPLAQASGELWTVAPEHGKGRAWMDAHGFNWPKIEGPPNRNDTRTTQGMVDDLNIAWRTQIAARQLRATAT